MSDLSQLSIGSQKTFFWTCKFLWKDPTQVEMSPNCDVVTVVVVVDDVPSQRNRNPRAAAAVATVQCRRPKRRKVMTQKRQKSCRRRSSFNSRVVLTSWDCLTWASKSNIFGMTLLSKVRIQISLGSVSTGRLLRHLLQRLPQFFRLKWTSSCSYSKSLLVDVG